MSENHLTSTPTPTRRSSPGAAPAGKAGTADATSTVAMPSRPVPENGAAIVTRISRGLHRQLKLHCLENDMTLTRFVTTALEEHLAARRKGHRSRSVQASW
jgi:hypothetical protein